MFTPLIRVSQNGSILRERRIVLHVTAGRRAGLQSYFTTTGWVQAASRSSGTWELSFLREEITLART